jgi:transmembrane 9 superfamily member 2/4
MLINRYNSSFLIFIIAVLIQVLNGFYVPGVAPQDFKKNDQVEVKGVKLTSIKTQLPYDYYTLPIHCKPADGIKYKSENLGEILRGDRIVNTGYKIFMTKNEKCRVLCKDVNLNEELTRQLAQRIQNDYHGHL